MYKAFLNSEQTHILFDNPLLIIIFLSVLSHHIQADGRWNSVKQISMLMYDTDNATSKLYFKKLL